MMCEGSVVRGGCGWMGEDDNSVHRPHRRSVATAQYVNLRVESNFAVSILSLFLTKD